MNFFKKYLEFKKMKSLIKQATETIYSERFDFDNILQRLLTQTDKLQALIAIKFAVYLDEPISKDDIKQALEEIYSAKDELKEEGEMQAFLKILQESTEIDWLERTKTILEGKLAFKENKYSYEASIYHLENIKKSPAPQKEKDKWKALSNNLEEAQKNYDDHLQKLKEAEEQESTKAAQAVLEKMIAERDERRKHMTDEEIQSEIAQAKIDREEIIKHLKETVQKIKVTDRLLRN